MGSVRRGNDICPDDGEPIEERHLIAGLVFVAYAVQKYGDVYMPILDRMEHELAELRSRERPSDRVKRIMETYTLDGGRKAIA